MSENPKQSVDALLADWSKESEASKEELDRLAGEVLASLAVSDLADSDLADSDLADSDLTDSDQVTLAGRETHWNSTLIWSAVVAAAVALVSVTMLLNQDRESIDPQIAGSTPHTRPTDLSSPIESFTESQREEKKQLLSELDRMFSGKRVWFAETDSDVVLGGDPISREGESLDQTTIAMRLVLAKRLPDSKRWTRVWTADVVARSDQVIQFLSDDPSMPATTCTAWAHVLPDGLIAADVNLKWDDGQVGRLDDSVLIQPGEPQKGARLTVGKLEYRIFHDAALLSEARS